MTTKAKVDAFIDTEPARDQLRQSTINHTKEALHVIQQAYERYSNEGLAISYNGGKDCLVLLVLLTAYLESLPDDERPKRTKAVYVAIKDPFKEVDDFVTTSAQEHHLDVIKIQKPMREAFEDYLHAHNEVKAILVGTRRTDPHGANLAYFDLTDGDWPRFMRVHPVINWEYAEVWDFLRALDIPYCPLYDRGYTSLGGEGDTLPNPSLSEDLAAVQEEDDAIERADETHVVRYKPAWQLNNGLQERLGRERAKKTERSAVVKINRRTSLDSDVQRPRHI